MKKNWSIKRVLQVLFCLVACVLVHRFCHHQTGGFSIAKIRSNHAIHPEWATPPLSEQERQELNPILNQPFKFFGYGGQAYVFLSEDGNVILKLFKQHHMRAPEWMKLIPLPKPLNKVRNKFITRKERNLTLFFNSCKIAYDRFKDRTGLIYLHLTPTNDLNQMITLIDKLGIAHQIDLDHTDFALQYKATLTKKHFLRLKKHNDIQAAKSSIDSLLALMVERSQQGIADRDPNLRRNCGFIGNEALEIDIGSYTPNEDLKISFIGKTDVYQKSLQLKRLISKIYPELVPYLEKNLRVILNTEIQTVTFELSTNVM